MLNKLNEKIIKREIWDSNYFLELDMDKILDGRDEKEFDSQWMRIYNMIQGDYIDNDHSNIIDSIRENIFVTLYEITCDSDLCAYVSDDFELMCKAYIININDAWLASLVNEYIQKKVPYGNLIEVTSDFSELFETFCE